MVKNKKEKKVMEGGGWRRIGERGKGWSKMARGGGREKKETAKTKRSGGKT